MVSSRNGTLRQAPLICIRDVTNFSAGIVCTGSIHFPNISGVLPQVVTGRPTCFDTFVSLPHAAENRSARSAKDLCHIRGHLEPTSSALGVPVSTSTPKLLGMGSTIPQRSSSKPTFPVNAFDLPKPKQAARSFEIFNGHALTRLTWSPSPTLGASPFLCAPFPEICTRTSTLVVEKPEAKPTKNFTAADPT